MTFPSHDKYRVDTAKFVEAHLRAGERLITPSLFGTKFPGENLLYSSSLIEHNYQWAIIHKGMLEIIGYHLLKGVIKKFKPVFANEVFVVFSTHTEMADVDRNSPHIQSLWEKMKLQG